MNKKTATVIQWALLLLILAATAYFLFIKQSFPLHSESVMTGWQVVIFGLSFAFVFTQIFLGTFKPFNCLKCMTGWATLALALYYNVPFPFLYLFVGVLVGAIVDRIFLRL